MGNLECINHVSIVFSHRILLLSSLDGFKIPRFFPQFQMRNMHVNDAIVNFLNELSLRNSSKHDMIVHQHPRGFPRDTL